ncbi:signal peptidase I [Deinococcus ruber]|uniref:signal peptidase I n=1 Tax=Deinococcus ruber TaxID=1848197 RepID=UPI00166AB205|nr:signal peptidase I [Deinococcus ruber]
MSQPESTSPATSGSATPAPSFLRRLWKELLEPIVFAVVITQFLGTVVGVDGVSMMPNLRHHERVFVPKYETWLHKAGIGDFHRGDILIFRPPAGAVELRSFLNLGIAKYRPFLIKRLIGLPGDKIRISQGVTYVNGKALDAGFTTDYWKTQGCWDTSSEQANNAAVMGATVPTTQQEITVPEGQYFVQGDNRTEQGSEDSRLFGTIPRRDVAGRATAVIWPIMRQETAKYDCNWRGGDPAAAVTFSGKSTLNWRGLGRPAAFDNVPNP